MNSPYRLTDVVSRAWRSPARALPLVCLLGLVASSLPVNAQLDKANNTNNLNLATSWTTTPVFDGTEVATWSSPVGANSTQLGANLSFLGINLTNPADNVTIGGTSLNTGAVTASAASDNFTYTGADVANGNMVTFTAGSMPTGLTAGQPYYVVNVNTGSKTYQIASSPGGVALDFSTNGTSVVNNARPTLTVGASGITNGAASQHLDINAAIRLAADQTWTANHARRIRASNVVDLGGRTLTFAPAVSAATVEFTGTLAGSGSVVVNGIGFASGSGTSGLVALSASSYTGSTTVKGGVLRLLQSTALAGSSSLTIDGGLVAFGANVTISSGVPVSVWGGSSTLSSGFIVGLGAAANGNLNVAGTTTLRSGTSAVLWNSGTNTGNLTFDTLTRDSTLKGLLVFGNPSYTTVSNITDRTVQVTNAPSIIGGSLGTFSAGVVPWVTNRFNDAMTYESGVGFRVLNASEYRTSFTGNFTSGDNVRLGASETLTATTTVNSFGGSGSRTLTFGGNSLTVSSGLVYTAGTLQIGTINTSNVEELRFGSQEAIFNGQGINILAKITGSGGITQGSTTNTVTGGVTLSNSNNSFTGGVRIQGGLMQINASEAIPDSNNVFVAQHGALQINVGTETIAGLSGDGVGRIGAAAPRLVIGTMLVTGNNSITLNTGGSLNPGNTSGSSDIRPGRLTLSTFSNTGTVSLIAGTINLDLNSATAFDSLGVNATTVSITSSTLALTLAYAPTLGQGFLILANDGADSISGMFSNLNSVTATFNSQTYFFDILYNTSLFGGTGNDIALVSVVPEPGTFALLALAGGMLLIHLRRRRLPC